MRFEYFERDEGDDRKILIAREKGSESKTFTMAGEIIGASKFSRKLICDMWDSCIQVFEEGNNEMITWGEGLFDEYGGIVGEL